MRDSFAIVLSSIRAIAFLKLIFERYELSIHKLWQLVWSGRKERRKDGLAVLFLALFPLSTAASDSSFQSHKTGGGTVVAVTKGLAFLVRISAPHI